MSGGQPFGAGMAWFQSSLALLKSQAARLLLVGLLLQLLGGASQVGILAFLFLLAAPALSAGMLQAMHLAAEDQRPSAFTLFAAFQRPGALLPLFLLGALGLFMIFLSMAFFVAPGLVNLDPELAMRIQSGDQNAMLELMELNPDLVQRVLLGMLFGLLLSVVLGFFAIPRIWFGGRSLGVALWDAVAMSLRQWRALTVLGLLLALIGIPVAVLSSMLVAAQLSSSNPSFLLTLVLLAVVVVYQVIGFAAQYVAYRVSFGIESGSGNADSGDSNAISEKDGPGKDRDDDQFVA